MGLNLFWPVYLFIYVHSDFSEVKDESFHAALPHLNDYIQTLQNTVFAEDDTIISALVKSCQ